MFHGRRYVWTSGARPGSWSSHGTVRSASGAWVKQPTCTTASRKEWGGHQTRRWLSGWQTWYHCAGNVTTEYTGHLLSPTSRGTSFIRGMIPRQLHCWSSQAQCTCGSVLTAHSRGVVKLSYSDITLTFPGGKRVGEGELELWLNALEADPEVTGLEMLLARSIVRHIRISAN